MDYQQEPRDVLDLFLQKATATAFLLPQGLTSGHLPCLEIALR